MNKARKTLSSCSCGGEPLLSIDWSHSMPSGSYGWQSICPICGRKTIAYHTQDEAKAAWNNGMSASPGNPVQEALF